MLACLLGRFCVGVEYSLVVLLLPLTAYSAGGKLYFGVLDSSDLASCGALLLRFSWCFSLTVCVAPSLPQEGSWLREV